MNLLYLLYLCGDFIRIWKIIRIFEPISVNFLSFFIWNQYYCLVCKLYKVNIEERALKIILLSG